MGQSRFGAWVGSVLFLLSFLFYSHPAFAWGPLGHRIVAETAALLMRDAQPQGWGDIIVRHRYELGFYAYLPDTTYRIKGKDTENPTHYFDIDLALSRKPKLSDENAVQALATLNYRDFVASQAPKDQKSTLEIGSAPWRIQQFHQLIKNTTQPLSEVSGKYQLSTESAPDALKVYHTLLHLGVLAHYTGDLTMPYHATGDYNGWATGQGGIHFYYENDCVNHADPSLASEVLASAKKNSKLWLKQWKAESRGPVSLSLAVLLDSSLRVEKVAQTDLKKIVLEKSNADSKPKKIAKRKPPLEGCPALRSSIIESLAKGAVLTTHIWSSSLNPKTDFSKARELQFSNLEADPDYIKPDYWP